MLQIIQKARRYNQRTAIISKGDGYTYDQLLISSEKFALKLLQGLKDLNEARVAFMVEPGFDYVYVQWGIWRAGGIAVPLCVSHPMASLQYTIEDSRASIIVASDQFESLLAPLAKEKALSLITPDCQDNLTGTLPEISSEGHAMILYTSGTTGLPKGVVTSHANIEAQIIALIVAWEWQPDDHILNVLPLHHVHGIINVISCALWSGACCQFVEKFSPQEVFNIFQQRQVNLFMSVPTIYFKLITYWENLTDDQQDAITVCMQDFRLMVSGSAALPSSVMNKWSKISGQILLERYGMTEMGMAISNPLNGERKARFIGQPLPDVQIRLVDEYNNIVAEGKPGEIQVKGPSVFKEYWNKPEATKESFSEDGWFLTGDIAVFENGSYKILGRSSVDIIKSGGYKISALEIEEVLRTHPHIKDCGVVGIPDDEWGEIVVACLVLDTKEINISHLKDWQKERLPGYKIPRHYIIRDDLPRNTMGKMTKNKLKAMFVNHIDSRKLT